MGIDFFFIFFAMAFPPGLQATAQARHLRKALQNMGLHGALARAPGKCYNARVHTNDRWTHKETT